MGGGGHNAMKRPIDPSDIKSLPLHLWPVAWSKANNLISNQILKPKPGMLANSVLEVAQ